jgi:hypothetical protein
VERVFVVQADITKLPAPYNESVYHGDTWQLDFLLLDNASTPHDLTGATVNAAVQNASATPVVLASLVSSLGTDPTQGTITLTPPSGGLDPGVYAFDMEVGEASQVATWVYGQLTVHADITA